MCEVRGPGHAADEEAPIAGFDDVSPKEEEDEIIFLCRPGLAFPERGHTFMGLICEGNNGVFLAIENPPSVASKPVVVDKVIELNSHVLAVCYQEETTCESILRDMQSQFRQHELETGRRNTVEEASKLVADALCVGKHKFRKRVKRYPADQVLLVGWDTEPAVPDLIIVNGVGERMRAANHSRGSGFPYLFPTLVSAKLMSFDR
ncbi:OLC1v1027541C1 [Oldenlandia corymbosa var. corymbosa]|uniref:OLC1v1027541C1 n=1 Tax=Oldenlandia corymbosa var. corymbosa TaxID=529605 RepID=A0AAV1C9R1_OLDCO|nr:OLC1v1027541C1 [Oldenlandia corymbosa var. corymbosa]